MKNNIFVMGVLLAAALSFIGCVKDASVAPVTEGVPYTIKADLSDTKTVNDGVSTKWKSGDALSVFHAVAGGEDYVSDGKFTVSSTDPEAGVFTGKLAGTLDAPEYDWYAVYPYAYNRATPAYQTTAISIIGSYTMQYQTGYDSMSHIAGSACPLYGVAKNVAGSSLPAVEMKYLASVIKIRVKNESGKPVVLESADFSSDEEIVGHFYVDFTAVPPVLKPKSVAATSTKASLTVSEGKDLANGASADLYMLIKPFTAEKGSDLTLKVNNVTKTVTLTEDVTFSAGKIKTLSFTIKEGDIKDASDYENPDGKQWFFTSYSGGFEDDAHKMVSVLDLGVYTPGKCYMAFQGDAGGAPVWFSILAGDNGIAFDYEIVPDDDTSGSIVVPEIGLTFTYSDLDGETMILRDEWGIFNEHYDYFNCKAGLYKISGYYNQFGGM